MIRNDSRQETWPMTVDVKPQGRDLFENPLGTDGFEFVEFTSPEPERLKGLFELMGFTAVSRHRSKNVLRFRQGDINFILNMEASGQPADFRQVHGPRPTPWPSASRT